MTSIDSEEMNTQGCPIKVGNERCRETETLDIINEFNDIYQSKLRRIDAEAGGDSLVQLQTKVELQQDWIRDLTQQNDELVKVVKELEKEATNRVGMLQKKLNNSAQCGDEVMRKYGDLNFSFNLNKTFQRLAYLQNDVQNLIEFIRRVRDDHEWSIEGLEFNTVSTSHLLGTNIEKYENSNSTYDSENNDKDKYYKELKLEFQQAQAMNQAKQTQELQLRDMEVKRLEQMLSQRPKESDIDDMNLKLQLKNEELTHVKRSMKDMQSTLTNEIAEQHDIIMSLRRDVQKLEEQCCHSDKQIQFKDANIKQLRKDIKDLKETRSVDFEAECLELRKRFKDLEDENKTLKDTIFQANRELEKLYEQANGYMNERDEYKRKYRESLDIMNRMEAEFALNKQELEKQNMTNKEIIEKLKNENQQHVEELINNRRLSESMNQAQHETIEALQEALREKDMVSKELRNLPLTTSDVSWLSVDEPVRILDKSETSSEKASVVCSSTCLTTCTGTQKLRELQTERDEERQKHIQEVANLKKTIEELEKALENTSNRAANLQQVVDSCQNSINVLEASQEKFKIEVIQLRMTIANLQEALVESKQQLNEMQQKSAGDIEDYLNNIYELKEIFLMVMNQCLVYHNETKNLNSVVEYLQDKYLNLEVENFEYVQNLAMLETRLLKHQHITRLYQNYAEENDALKEKIQALEHECSAMKRVVNEAKELHQSFILMHASNNELQKQADQARHELIRESKINEIGGERIEELQQLLGEKTVEMNRTEELLHDTQQKLCWTVCQNNEMRKEITQLLDSINEYQQNYSDNEKNTDYCRKEIESCKENLSQLKDKLLKMKELLQQKVDQYNRLEGDYCKQNNVLMGMQKQVAENKLQYDKQICDMNYAIKDLTEKLEKSDKKYQFLYDDYQKSQARVAEHDNSKGDYSEKLQAAKTEISRLNDCIGQLEAECCYVKKELLNKDQQLLAVKAQIKNYKFAENHQVNNAELEIDSLWGQLNHLKQHNEILCAQLCESQMNIKALQQHHQNTGHHVQDCMCQLRALQDENSDLQERNEKYKQQLKQLHCTYTTLNHSYQHVIKSVEILKHDRDEVCVESRNVIDNVRAWLEDQDFINQQLTEKVRSDSLIIDRLTRRVAMLEAMKCKCINRQRGGSNPNPSVHGLSLSLDSLGLSPGSSSNSSHDWYPYDNENDYSDVIKSPQLWLKKIENMTEELQKSHQYWQTKLSDDYLVTRDQ